MNTNATEAFLADHGIVPMVADLSDPNPEADALLRELGHSAQTIPYYAIFPGDGSPPITFDGLPVLTQSHLLEKLQGAVPAQQLSSDQAGQPTIR